MRVFGWWRDRGERRRAESEAFPWRGRVPRGHMLMKDPDYQEKLAAFREEWARGRGGGSVTRRKV